MAIKVDLITGFLGSGKTTFLRKYVTYLKKQGLNVCILENDYGAVNVDMMLLSDLVDDKCDIEMVAGGCDYDCHKRRFKSKLISMGMLGYDRVVIEPSGIFDVDEFFDTLHEEPIDRWYECGSVICIADAVMLGEMKSRDESSDCGEHSTKERLSLSANDIEESVLEQNETLLSDDSKYVLATEAADAGILIFSKVQKISEDAVQNVIERINDALLSVHCARKYSVDGRDVLIKNWDDFTENDFELISNAGFKSHDFVKRQIMDDNGYKSLYFMNKDFLIDEVKDKARLILNDETCGKVIRIKGFVEANSDMDSDNAPELAGKNSIGDTEKNWYEINATKNDITVEKIPEGQRVIIVIGEELNKERISSYYGEPADVHADARLD